MAAVTDVMGIDYEGGEPAQAQLSLLSGAFPEARELIVAAYERFHEGFWTIDLQRASTIIEELEGSGSE